MKFVRLFIVAALFGVSVGIAAETPGPRTPDNDALLEDLYFSPDSIHLSAKEMNALAIAKS